MNVANVCLQTCGKRYRAKGTGQKVRAAVCKGMEVQKVRQKVQMIFDQKAAVMVARNKSAPRLNVA